MQLERRDVFARNGLIREGISRAIYEKMKEDPMLYTLGEGNHVKWWFDYRKVYDEFRDRIITWPIAEQSGIHAALGASLLGVHPVFDVITGDFLWTVMDSICNTTATTWRVSGGRIGPIVIRAEFLLLGPSTGERLEAIFAHVPNLNVVIPSNPLDAYDLMKDALGRKEVTVFFEDRMIVDTAIKTGDKFPYPAGRPQASIGRARVRRWGNSLTVVSYGLTLQRAENVIDVHPEWGITLIDLTTIQPFDKELIFASVLSTGSLLFIEPDIVAGGVGAEVVAFVAEKATELNCQIEVRRIGAPLRTIPASPILLDYVVPSEERIAHAIKGALHI